MMWILLRNLLRRFSDFSEYPNVVGVGIGWKMVGGRRTNMPSITILVSHKLDAEAVPFRGIIPRRAGFLPTDVVQVGKLVVHTFDPKQSQRPLVAGSSIGTDRGTGTAGLIVRHNRTGLSCILTNAHVAEGRGRTIYQPGPHDSDHPRKFGYVSQCLFPDQSNGLLDAATVETHERLPNLNVPDIGRVRGTVEPRLWDRFAKVGRTSGLTIGAITLLEVEATVSYGESRGSQKVRRAFLTTPCSQPGDSGSVMIVSKDNKAVGLLFAGSDEVTLAFPIRRVLQRLAVYVP